MKTLRSENENLQILRVNSHENVVFMIYEKWKPSETENENLQIPKMKTLRSEMKKWTHQRPKMKT